MKLIIDIPEGIYLNARTGYLCDSPTLAKAVENGIPYEEQPIGKWLLRSGDWICSKCGAPIANWKGDEQETALIYRYCRFCGNRNGKDGEENEM